MPGRAKQSDDAPWKPVRLEPTVDTNDLGAMLRAVEDLEMDADGRDQFQLVEVEPQRVDVWVPCELRHVSVETYRRIRRVA
jgi:hypothetical protein